jgi:hypothetical protein
LTFAACIATLLAALLVFLVVENDIAQYRALCYFSLALGGGMSLFYFCSIREVYMGNQAIILDVKYQYELDISKGKQPDPLPDTDEAILEARAAKE